MNPTNPDQVVPRANTRALKDWNQDMERAKFVYVRDTPFPQQDKTLVHGEQHSLLSCLYYHELKRLAREAAEAKRGKETKGAPALKRRSEDSD